MSVSAYIRSAVWDYLLVSAASAALAYMLMDGFYIAPALQYSPFCAVVVAAVLALLFATGYDRRTVRMGAVAFAVLAAAGIMAASALSDASLLDDAESNYVPFALIALLVPLLSYLLSRRRFGALIFFIAGTFASSWIEFFYARHEVAWMFVFVISSLALVVYKNYQLSARTATTVGKLSFAAGFGVALAMVAVSVGIGALAWFAVIAPLAPDAMQIKLMTEVRALETTPVKGSADEYLTPNMELTSDKTNSDERTTDDLQQSPDGRPEPARPRDEAQVQEEASGTFLGIDVNSVFEAFDMDPENPIGGTLLLFLLLVPLAIVAYFVGRRLHRNHRLHAISRLAPAEQVGELYRFLLDRLARVGFPLPAGSTLTEFAANAQGAMSRMDAATGASFAALTRTYVGVVYGNQEPTGEQIEEMSRYYRSFWKAARQQLGNLRYFFKSFRL